MAWLNEGIEVSEEATKAALKGTIEAGAKVAVSETEAKVEAVLALLVEVVAPSIAEQGEALIQQTTVVSTGRYRGVRRSTAQYGVVRRRTTAYGRLHSSHS